MARFYLPLCTDEEEPILLRYIIERSSHLLPLTVYSFPGIPRDTLLEDPQLYAKRQDLVKLAINKLSDVKMVVEDHRTDTYTIMELGRIAAKYYLRYTSIEIFNKEFRPRMSEADILAMLSMSTEVKPICRFSVTFQ